MDGGAVNLTTFQTGQRPVRNNLHQLVTAVQLASGGLAGIVDTCKDLHRGLVRTCIEYLHRGLAEDCLFLSS